MANILFISHRMPYPPDKGDKIRAYQIIEGLKKCGHNVSLAFLIDDKDDFQHIPHLEQGYDDLVYHPFRKVGAALRVVTGGLTGKALSSSYQTSFKLKRKIQALQKRKQFDYVYYFSGSSLCYYNGDKDTVHIADFVDADSAKWESYSHNYHFPLSVLYKREAKKMAEIECRFAKACDLSLFVSHEEAKFFKENYNIEPAVAEKIDAIQNIVDCHYFTPDFRSDNPYQEIFPDYKHICVMTGVMDYKPNIDAVEYFAKEVLPAIEEDLQEKVAFAIVGRNPTSAVKKLARENVFVTGAVPDVRPYLKHASASVCPLFIARGVQNKILEAMSMQKAVIASPEALNGIQGGQKCLDYLSAQTKEEWVLHLREVLLNDTLADRLGANARRVILEHYAPEIMPLLLKDMLKKAKDNKDRR